VTVGLFFLGLLLWGVAIGWIGQLLIGKARKPGDRDWYQALIAGAVGSLVGGTIGSLLAGEGFQLRIGGIVASILGAVIVLLVWNAVRAKRT
jgi:uncharacterized membrane protein YeaQ/YmgE (transglycosylase-associated protein family)